MSARTGSVALGSTLVKVHQGTVEISTRGRGLTDVSRKVQEIVEASGIATGLCTVFIQLRGLP